MAPCQQVLREAFDDFAALRPLKGAAEILANDDSWGPLFDLDQLAKNEVKVSAATSVSFPPTLPFVWGSYANDMQVLRGHVCPI
jgi:hypothetical protein